MMKFFLSSMLACLVLATPAQAGRKQKEAEAAAERKAIHARAEAGDAEAQWRLCSDYDFGLGETRDPAMAASWCRKAAEQGVVEAQSALGNMLLLGEGVEQDWPEAAIWLQRAVDRGNGLAMTNLGLMYENGHGVPKSGEKAADLYRRAAALGLPAAMSNLGCLILDGDGVPVDLVDGFAWIDLAVSMTNFEKDMHVKWTIRAAFDYYGKRLTPQQRAAAHELADERAKELRRAGSR